MPSTTYISNLRGVLGKDRIQRETVGYRLVAMPEELDGSQFESYDEEASRLIGTDPEEAVSLFEAALRLWRGPAFEGHEDLPSIEPEAARLNELRVSAQERRFEAMLRTANPPDPAEVELLCKGEAPARATLQSVDAVALQGWGVRLKHFASTRPSAKTLGEELGIEPSPALARLEEQILLQDPALDPAAEHESNLPLPVTSFVGRVNEQVSLDGAIRRHRLVTILGPGGAGKTRLAVETARTLVSEYPDGVWLIDLARVADSRDVSEAVAATLGVGGDESASDGAILRWLAGRNALIVLDNCEHVRDRAGELALSILERTPRCPDPGHEPGRLESARGAPFPAARTGGQLRSIRTVHMIEHKAVGAAVSQFDADSVETLCQRLEGLPLAIELAASRTNIRSVDEIGAHLTPTVSDCCPGNIPAGTSMPPLESAIWWSTSLLDDAQRNSFQTLGVFEGPFELEAATSVWASNTEKALADLKNAL